MTNMINKWDVIRTVFVSVWLLHLATACGQVKGQEGKPGSPGAKGDSGASCSISPIPGGARLSCPDGSHQDITNGQDAEPVTVVQLCPMLPHTHYPDNFPEQAVCINHELYGVYWDHSNAFLAVIVPGNYVSTSPQGCSFIVAPDCQVN